MQSLKNQKIKIFKYTINALILIFIYENCRLNNDEDIKYN